jgi:glycosyltransferase involved in cell wall biosynthesis
MYHGNLAALIGRIIAGSAAPLVWSVHNTLVAPVSHRWLTRAALQIGARTSRCAAAVVYVSAASVPQHEAIGFRQDRSIVIPNGTDCEHFCPDPDAGSRLRAALGVAGDTPLVGLFSRWDPVKGHPFLFAAARRLLNEGWRLHLVLAGTGITAENDALRRALDDAGMLSHASLLGERDNVEALAPALDLFVLPSTGMEAFPLVLGEAMAAGVPCVATDVGDSAWIIGKGGRVVRPGDADALAAAVRELLGMTDTARRALGLTGRQRIVEHFSLTTTVRGYEELYMGLHARVTARRAGNAGKMDGITCAD